MNKAENNIEIPKTDKNKSREFPTIQECLRMIGMKELTANVFCVPSKKQEVRTA